MIFRLPSSLRPGQRQPAVFVKDNQFSVGWERIGFSELAAGPPDLAGADVNGGEQAGTGVSAGKIEHTITC
jgi:hypothetical protein